MRPRITVLMDLPASNATHRATVAALAHAIGTRRDRRGRGWRTDADVAVPGAGVVIGPGSPYRDPDRAEGRSSAWRESAGLPLVGT